MLYSCSRRRPNRCPVPQKGKENVTGLSLRYSAVKKVHMDPKGLCQNEALNAQPKW